MQPFIMVRSKSYPSRTEKVSAINKAVKKGTYKIDSRNLADILVLHLLDYSTRFQRLSVKLH